MPKVRYHHGDLRFELLQAARTEIALRGAESVSLSSLARQTGVSQPAPYRHFADRDALFSALATQGVQELADFIQVTSDTAGKNSAWQMMAVAYVTFGEANIELYRLMFASRLVPQAEPGSDLGRAADKAFELLRVAMEHASKSLADAYLLWAQLHGLVMLKADGFLNESAVPLAKLAVQLPPA